MTNASVGRGEDNGHRSLDDARLADYLAGGKTPTVGTNLPASFWCRPALVHIRDAAYARGRSADAVLHAAFARLSAVGPPELKLPAIVGGPASLNIFTNLVSGSGTGKSTAVAISIALLPCSDVDGFADLRPIGSGEGIAETFMGVVDEGGVKVRRQVRANAFFVVDEGQALMDLMGRSGSILPSELRKAWSGSALGQTNASEERRRHVTDYRLGLVVAFQPELAGELLADATGGTPQRFMWATATDPNVPTDPPDWPGELVIPEPSRDEEEAARRRSRTGGQWFGVHPEIEREIRAEDLARVRGLAVMTEPLDAHATLTRLKIAALLATLEGRLTITPDDWRLAGQVWATSCAVRDEVRRAVAIKADHEEVRALARLGRRAEVDEASRQGVARKVERLARRLAGFVHESPGEEFTGRDLRQRLRSDERVLSEQIERYAIDNRWLVRPRGGGYYAGPEVP